MKVPKFDREKCQEIKDYCLDRVDKLLHVRNNDSEFEDRFGNITNEISLDLRYAAKCDFLISHNVENFRANFKKYFAEKFKLFERSNAGELINIEFIDVYTEQTVMDGFAAGLLSEAYQFTASLVEDTDIATKKSDSLVLLKAKALKSLVLFSDSAKSDLENYVQAFTNKPSEYHSIYVKMYQSLLNQDINQFEKLLNEFIERDMTLYKSECDHLCVEGLGLLNWARSRGMNVNVVSDFIPDLLKLPVKNLDIQEIRESTKNISATKYIAPEDNVPRSKYINNPPLNDVFNISNIELYTDTLFPDDIKDAENDDFSDADNIEQRIENYTRVYRTSALGKFILHQDIESFKSYLHEAASMRLKFLEQDFNSQRVQSGFIFGFYPTIDLVFDLLAAGLWQDVLQVTKKIWNDRRHLHQVSVLHVHMLMCFSSCLLGLSFTEELVQKFLAFLKEENQTHYDYWPKLCYALYSGELDEVNNLLNRLIADHIEQVQDYEEGFINAVDRVICTPALGLINMFRFKGSDISIDHPMIPKALLVPIVVGN
ncbi:MAG: hypothetical protein V4629_06510 [Pseudomonadota bacterium]